MAPPGVDLIVGGSRDAVFGPVVLAGIGGTVADAIDDVAVATAPLSAVDAASLLDELAGKSILDGTRGRPVVDRAAVGVVLANLGAFVAANPDVDALEINPLRATSGGLIALDAVLTRTTKARS
jgi:acetyltransferase